MTRRHCLAAALVSLTCTSSVFAQVPAVPVPAPVPVMPATVAPPAPPQTPRPFAVALPDIDLVLPDFDVDWPDVDWPDVDWPDIAWPEIDVAELKALAESARLFAQEARAITQITPAPPAPPAPPAARVASPFVFTGKGLDDSLYNQARSFIDRDQYERAIESLDRMIARPGPRTDAAMYWKAYSQLKLARHEDALVTLAALRKQFPSSSWVRDASALEVEVRQASGQSVNADAQASDDLKLLALQGIMRSDPDTAIPVIEKTLAGTSSVRVKERALFVLSQSRVPRAREVISATAKGASNPDLRLSAIRYLGRMSTPESQQALEDVYRGTSDLELKQAIIQTLATDRNAAAKLVALARAEKDTALKTEIVRRLSTSRAPEAREYLLELLR